MILFAVGLLLSIALARNVGGSAPRLLFRTYLMAFLLLLAWLIENAATYGSLFKSDELYYFEAAHAQLSWSIEKDKSRLLWHLLNHVMVNYDFVFEGWALKIFSVPMCAASVVLIYSQAGRSERVEWIIYLLPYFIWVSTFNFRDTLVLLLTLLFFAASRRANLLCLPALVVIVLLMLFLRPFVAYALLIISGIGYIWSQLRSKRFGRVAIGAIFIFALLGQIGLGIDMLRDPFDEYVRWFDYTSNEGKQDRLDSIEYDYVDPATPVGFAYALVRFMVTPLPSSIAWRLLHGGGEEWGLVDDLVRFWHQTGLFALFVYMTINARFLLAALLGLNRHVLMLLLALSLYAPIYAYHLLGVTHSRAKIPVHIAVFLLCLAISEYKKARIGATPYGVNTTPRVQKG